MLDKDQLEKARNEIYARHGYKFKTDYIQEYFNSCSWYKGTIEAEDFKINVFNEFELKNIHLIKKIEQKKGYIE